MTHGDAIAVPLEVPDSDESMHLSIDARFRNSREQANRLHVLEPIPNGLENQEFLGAEHLFETVRHDALPPDNLDNRKTTKY